MRSYVQRLQDLDRSRLTEAGGKGAHLGELSGIAGVNVPDGFCVSTAAYKQIIAHNPELGGLLDKLARLKSDDRAAISEACARVRETIESISIPKDVAEEVAGCLTPFGEHAAFAVRSSATAEDLPTASFAGQQDTYLNIVGKESVLQHLKKCWASLFTDRAVIYRIQNGFDHRKVQQAVVIQKMILPQASGVLFTADPVTGHRKVLAIDASFGLGEALVSGLVNADHYKVRDGKIVAKTIAAKTWAIDPLKGGGTKKQAIEPERQNSPALSDEQILRLAQLGRTIESHFGSPQDIEWCLANNMFYIVQSRSITTLFPIPEANDEQNHVYVSVGHQQMMTDPMKPLGLSFFLLTTRAPMRTAAGRLFVDVTTMLARPTSRKAVIENLGRSDPLIKDALTSIVERGDFVPSLPDEPKAAGPAQSAPPSGGAAVVELDQDAASRSVERSQQMIAASKLAMQTKSGSGVFDFIQEDIKRLQKSLFEDLAVIKDAMDAAFWINENMKAWLGEINVADTLSLSVPHNVTSEMGLALLDVADVIRPYPEVVEHLRNGNADIFLEELPRLEGGSEARKAITAFLEKYGMRCSGEIDVTKPRWVESPATLIPIILGNIKNFVPGESRRRFDKGRTEALNKERDLLERLRQLPDGVSRAEETKCKITILRSFSGYREYPKYFMVNHYFIYKQALLKEADKLVQLGVVAEREDVFFLTFAEFHEAVQSHCVDRDMIGRRKEELASYAKLTPPRVLTSDGEIITGAYKREDLPPRAIAGLAVSSGIIEGRARVILSMEDAVLEDGDILVTAFTDPSWTPLFVSIKGLVTEVGGLMTHGAVIAREYGLPAVVGVERATKLIRDGQKIRVNGTHGYVEILS